MSGRCDYTKISSSEEGEDGATSPLLASSPDLKKEAGWSGSESDTGHN